MSGRQPSLADQRIAVVRTSSTVDGRQGDRAFDRPGPRDAIEPAWEQPSPTDSLYFQIAETTNDIVIVTTPDLDPPGPLIVYVNNAFTRLTGYSAADAIGRPPRFLHGPETDGATLDAIGRTLRAGQESHERILNVGKDGERHWLDMRIVPLRDGEGTITHFAAIGRDITDDLRRFERGNSPTDIDGLTGVPNRRALLRVILSEIQAIETRRTGSPRTRGGCLAVIDVDYFKSVNDVVGTEAGDALLAGVAARLSDNLRRSDMLGRIGEDEFAIWMPAVSLREGKFIADLLRRVIADDPFETQAGSIAVTVSIGVALFHENDGLSRLMERANAAKSTAKKAGRNRVIARVATEADGR